MKSTDGLPPPINLHTQFDKTGALVWAETTTVHTEGPLVDLATTLEVDRISARIAEADAAGPAATRLSSFMGHLIKERKEYKQLILDKTGTSTRGLIDDKYTKQ